MPGPDPSHWLHRLTADEWLAAADNELRATEEALTRRAQRPGVTHARRAAGMALNALLTREPHESWGRSYMDHVAALVEDPGVPDAIRAAARALREVPTTPPALLQIGKPDLGPLTEARRICDWVRGLLPQLEPPGPPFTRPRSD